MFNNEDTISSIETYIMYNQEGVRPLTSSMVSQHQNASLSWEQSSCFEGILAASHLFNTTFIKASHTSALVTARSVDCLTAIATASTRAGSMQWFLAIGAKQEAIFKSDSLNSQSIHQASSHPTKHYQCSIPHTPMFYVDCSLLI